MSAAVGKWLTWGILGTGGIARTFAEGIAASETGTLIAVGFAAWIGVQIMLNVGMNLSLVPVVGIPLPLFSYGGSAIMTVMICLGMLMAIERQNRQEVRKG